MSNLESAGFANGTICAINLLLCCASCDRLRGSLLLTAFSHKFVSLMLTANEIKIMKFEHIKALLFY
jgi:hypothetical protein